MSHTTVLYLFINQESSEIASSQLSTGKEIQIRTSFV